MIEIKDNHLKGATTYRDIIFNINGKSVSVEVCVTSDEYTPVTSVEHTYIEGEDLLSDEEKDELGDFINTNY